MTLKYFPVLVINVAASMAFLFAALLPRWPQPLTLLAGVPLAYYHLIYLRPKAKHLASAAIDSVYYFGFLLTIAALAISAVEIAGAGPDLQHVLYKFAVGLLATGYAVLARIHLLSISGEAVDVSAESVLDTYIQRSRELVDNVEIAILRTSAFSQTVIQQASEMHTRASTLVNDSMLDAARAFGNELNTTLSSAREGIAEVRNLVSDAGFVSERVELAKLVTATIASSKDLNQALTEFATRSRAGAEGTLKLNEAVASLDGSINVLGTNLTQLVRPDGGLPSAVAAVQSVTAASAQNLASISETADAIKALANEIAEASAAFGKMGSFADSTSAQLESLGSVAKGFDSAIEGLSAVTGTTKTLASEISATTSTFPELSRRAQDLALQMQSVKDALAETSKELEADVTRSTKAASMLTESLTKVAQTIIDRTQERQRR